MPGCASVHPTTASTAMPTDPNTGDVGDRVRCGKGNQDPVLRGSLHDNNI
jgi:hypothetical protein